MNSDVNAARAEDVRPPKRRAAATIEERIADLEYAHAAALEQTLRVLAYVAGWGQDDVTGFVVSHVEGIRRHQAVRPPTGGPTLAARLDALAESG